MAFTAKDKKFMKIALDEARKAFDAGDYPVGAVLVIDGKFVDSGRNALYTNKNWVSHAELGLLSKHAGILRERTRKGKAQIELYTTLEPCLMCMGTALLNRVRRIVIACPDPHGGASQLDPKNMAPFYGKRWPKVETGLFREEAYDLLTDFMRKNTPDWGRVLIEFQDMKKKW